MRLLVTVCFKEMFLAQLTRPHARVACFFFSRHVLTMSPEEGTGDMLNLLSVGVQPSMSM